MFVTDSAEPKKDVLTTTQKSLDQWNATLRITGGALEPSKTFFCVINGPLRDSNVQPLTVQDATQRTLITRKEPEESFFSLGIWQSPMGTETKQVEHMIEKIETWSNKTGDKGISRYHARTAVSSTLGRTLVYPLPASCFTQKESVKIQRSLNQATLGMMGISRSVAHTLAITPTKLGGYGILDIQIEQLVQHIHILAQHMHDDSVTGRLIHISLDQYIFESGKGGDPFICYNAYTTPSTWIDRTIEDLCTHGIKLHHNTPSLREWGHGDRFIMDHIQQCDKKYGKSINRVRMYLWVVTLADITTANGLQIDKHILQGNRSTNNPSPSQTCYNWGEVQTPTKKDREL